MSNDKPLLPLKVRPRIDLTGQRFGRLLVTGVSHKDARHMTWFDCVCDCGTERKVRSHTLRLKDRGTRSCGCITKDALRARATHGHTRGGRSSREYMTWRSMIARCTKPEHHSYPAYGGRGITVCERWLHFPSFAEDMGSKPEGASLDRRDNNKGYEAANCRWATPRQQVRNRRGGELTGEQVRHIKMLLRLGERHADVANSFRVRRETISKIARGEQWADVQV